MHGGTKMNWKLECSDCKKQIIDTAFIYSDKLFCSRQCYDKYIEEITIKSIKKLKKR